MKTEGIYILHKRVGETPLQALERLREERHIPAEVPLAYAGRLDPMAEGKLLVLAGEECKRIHSYYNLDKEYRVSVLLGLQSDSHDVLGVVRAAYDTASPPTMIYHSGPTERIAEVLRSFVGDYSWPYPVLSSKPVDGKPLFQWFLEGRLDEIDIPRSTGTIYRLTLNAVRTVTPTELKRRTFEKIRALAKVTDESKRLGRDFRRHEVIDSWRTWFDTLPPDSPLHKGMVVLDITCTASAGTYMRTLAHEIGSALGTGGLALEIHRAKIGKYVHIGKYGFWVRSY